MNKFIFFIQLLFIYTIKINSLPFSSPEECLKQLNCKDDDLNCVASCYNVPSPDRNSVIKTADCQNGCLAKYPNNLPTDWANLNQCYLDCVQNNYFNSPAEYIAATTNNNNSNTSTTNTNNINTNNNNTNTTNTINTLGNNNTNNTSTLNQNNSDNTGHPINATDHLPNVVVQENSFISLYTIKQTLITTVVVFFIFLAFN